MSYNKCLVITSDKRALPTILKLLEETIFRIKINFSRENLSKQLIRIANIIDKDIGSYADKMTKTQSVAWNYVNHYIPLDDLDENIRNSINILIIGMNYWFEICNDVISVNADITRRLDIANEISYLMKSLGIPIAVHSCAYGKITDPKDLKRHNGKSYIRRPIAKAELVLAWLAEIFRKSNTGKKDYNVRNFMQAIAVFMQVFLRRDELLSTGNYCFEMCNQIILLIRLLELAYLTVGPDNSKIDLYRCIYHEQALFKYLRDFNDIRLDLDGPLSYLSYIPRRLNEKAEPDTLFYNPVGVDINSPIYDATKSWIKCMEKCNNSTFNDVKYYTAYATFGYESKFTGNKEEFPLPTPDWYSKAVDFIGMEEEYKQKIPEIKNNLIQQLQELHIVYSDIIFEKLRSSDLEIEFVEN